MFPEHMTLGQHCEGDLFDLILTSHQQSFNYVGTGLPGLNRYEAMINVSCSRTQRSDACEARTRGPSVSCSLNKPGYEENYPCADPEGAGAPGPAKSQSYRIYLAILVWIHLKISKASQNSMLGH